MPQAYKVEELLALRDSVSESAVSLERFADEDVIKEHVLRPSVSASLIGTHSEKSSRPSVTANLVAGASANKKPSPSPSVKRGKAERLLKEHGSPPGMRVTAGGRVVPSDLPPLTSPRHPHNNSSSQTSSCISPTADQQSHSVPDFSKLAPNGSLVYDTSGQPCLYLNNQLLPIQGVDGTGAGYLASNSMYPSMAPPGRFMGRASDTNMLSVVGSMPGFGIPPTRNASQSNTFLGNQIVDPAIRLHQLKKEQIVQAALLRKLEQTEVIYSESNTPTWRESIIQQKRDYINHIDVLRKQIKELESNAANTGMPSPHPSFTQYQPPVVRTNFPHVGLPVTAIGLANTSAYPTADYLYPPFHGTAQLSSDSSQYSAESRMFSSADASLAGIHYSNTAPTMSSGELGGTTHREQASQSPTWPNSATRRSHAIEIKDPRDGSKKLAGYSILDPRSPTYQPKPPAGNVEAPPVFVPPTPSPIPSPKQNEAVQAKHSWLFEQPSDKSGSRSIRHKPSMSSVSTADFFPNNTHEHSSTRIAPPKAAEITDSSKGLSENTFAPVTPEKNWPSSPWNQDHRSGGEKKASGLSNQVSPLSTRLSSLTQEFKPRSDRSDSLAGPVSLQGRNIISRSHSKAGTPKPESVLSAVESRKTSTQRSAESEWTPLNTKSINHIPSTYQEGYQAGLAHKGLPANLDVIRGYFEGLSLLLKDGQLFGLDGILRNAPSGSLKSTSSAYRINGSGFTPNDSAVSLSFPSRPVDQAGLAQENARAVSANPLLPAPTFGSAISSSKSIWSPGHGGVPLTYGSYNEAVNIQVPSRRASSAATKGPLSSHQSDKMVQEQTTVYSSSRGGSMYKKAKGHAVQQDSTLSHGPLPRQFSGNQMGHYNKGTPTSQQRFYPGHKEYVPNANQTTATASTRTGDQRFSSGYDGAMDDLAELMDPVSLSHAEQASTEASCFKSSNSKGSKNKTASSPAKSPESPKKSGELSPAKARLEQIANKVRRSNKRDSDTKKEDPAVIFEDRKRWREDWRKRFRNIKDKEAKEIEQYKRENPLPN
ncbi:hypothetical protein K432DRAFT_423502 [Lepidopterella palustris CBS 459.81]|uniref:Uncharacterized protein n=1 Tax=Lepidopterella palustris CBS 459.81 TaxID=1314670 RepID=A0A8E2EGR4_9PEZI|nr:hypothetical protein K432DRAFT_423502 [Lepidopterella palustris CBS 459.81]